ncbi:hypothetical protein A7J50_2748 [Pseudomonas antarctica]|uniref:Uncharacterized protein n=1 Tax=Pseudomonas antarctica TaxID=219572 RepID=A0A172Z1S3_9PSED|nr:hypothetical protein [Pseudomonas antarctica]ANF86146.1 hypothetical protein A7J50_2748 [Pseudomonas antarctica]
MSTVSVSRTAMPAYVSAASNGEAKPLNPSSAPRAQDRPDASEQSSVAGALQQWGGQLKQVGLEQHSIRSKREAPSADPVRKPMVYPASEPAKQADANLQKTLTHLLLTGKLRANPFPPNASISPFIEAFIDAVREPPVQAWLNAKGLDVSTVRVFSDGVAGSVVVGGETVTRRFTTTDGSGWWQVGAKVSEAVKKLRPDDLGVLLPGNEAVPFRDLNAILHFYGVNMPSAPTDGKQLGERLKKAGWPAISNETRNEWRQRFEQLSQKSTDVDVRSQLASQLQAQVADKNEGDTLNLSDLPAVIYPESTLAQKSQRPRERFVEWLAMPAFKTFMEKTGLGGADTVYRLSNGNLELRDAANQWISLHVFLDDEISKVSVGGSPAEKAAIHSLNNDFNQLVERSKATGNVVYSRPLYDLRQLLSFSGLGSPETVAQVNSAIAWLTTRLPPPPTAGDFGGLSPYTWAPGALSSNDLIVLKAASIGPGSVTQLLVSHMARIDLPNDRDLQLQGFFDSAHAVAEAQALAQRLNMAEVKGGQPLSRATRHQLLAAAIKAGTGAELPGKPGVVAGYDIYQPNNLGRTLDEVRGDIETQLESKVADAKMAPLIAHLLLAQAAPEFLVKPDPGVSAQAPESLKLSPGQVSMGSTAWMNLRLGCAMADKLGGAGSSRSLNITQAQALTRLNPMGLEHETLIKCLGAPTLLDWAVMSGVFPKRSDGFYSAGDYSAAAQAFADRENSTHTAFQSLTSEPPSQTSLLINQLALLFPEMTQEEIANFKLELDTDTPYNPRNEGHLEPRQLRLTDVILTQQASLDPLTLLGDVLNKVFAQDKTYRFIHPKVSQETFNDRVSKLSSIASLVTPAVDQYLADSRRAEETVIKLMIANAPLDVRQGLESGDVEIFTLREETGESLERDQGKDSKVADKRAKRGVLLRYKNKGEEGGYTYLEMFPGSMKVSKRHLLFSELKLDGVVEKDSVPYGPFAHISVDFRKAAPVDFDFQAYQTGSELRPGVRTKAIIEKFGQTLPGQAAPRRSNVTPVYVPNSWASRKTNDIAKAIVAATFDGKRQALLDYANEPTKLRKRRTYPFDSGKVFTHENLRTVLSLIPFVGAVADIGDGNIGAGFKGLLIDFASFAFTGGLAGARNFFKGLKAIVPFSGTAFTLRAVKGVAPFFRSLFNPLDGVSDVLRIGPKAIGATRQVLAGKLVPVGKGFYLTTTAFEKCRWGLGVYDTLYPQPVGQETSMYPSSQLGVSQNCALRAVQIDTLWYAIDPVTQQPTGAPLQDFTPDSPVS